MVGTSNQSDPEMASDMFSYGPALLPALARFLARFLGSGKLPPVFDLLNWRAAGNGADGSMWRTKSPLGV